MKKVYIPIPIENVEEAEKAPSLTYRLDLEHGRIAGKIDGLDAVNQAIRKAIITPRFKCLVYDNQYGSEIEAAIIENDPTPEYVEAATAGFIKDALLPDTRILEVYDFKFSFEGDKAFIHFKADTVFGKITVEEVI